MTKRFCPGCQGEVVAVDGHCLLGHRVSIEAPMRSLSELRDEVDKAFEEARRQVAEALSTVAAPAAPVLAPLPEAVGSGGATPAAAIELHQAEIQRPRLRAVPPPPPPPLSVDAALQIEEHRRSVFAALEQEQPLAVADPIVEFAPPPRMDWGPERGALRLRRHDQD